MRRVVLVGLLAVLGMAVGSQGVGAKIEPTHTTMVRTGEEKATPTARKRTVRHLSVVGRSTPGAAAVPRDHAVLSPVLGAILQALRNDRLSSEWRGALTVARAALQRYGVEPPSE